MGGSCAPDNTQPVNDITVVILVVRIGSLWLL